MRFDLRLWHSLAISAALHFIAALVAPAIVPPRPSPPSSYFHVRVVSEATPPPTVAVYRPAGAPVARPSLRPGSVPGRAGREGASRLAPQATSPAEPVPRRGADQPVAPVEVEERRGITPGLPDAVGPEIEVPALASEPGLSGAERLAFEPETEHIGEATAPPSGVGALGLSDSRGAPASATTAGDGGGPRGSPEGNPSGGAPGGRGIGESGSGRGGGTASSGSGAGSGGDASGFGGGGAGGGSQSQSAAPLLTRGPVLISAPPMPRTREMERLEIHGHVRIRVSVNASGVVTSATLVSVSGYPEVDAAAVEWVRGHWRFQPALANGRSCAGTTVVAVRF